MPNGQREGLTVPLDVVCKEVAKASQPRMRAISCTRAFVSRALMELERSWESLAIRQGCLEMWTLGGRLVVDMFGRFEDHKINDIKVVIFILLTMKVKELFFSNCFGRLNLSFAFPLHNRGNGVATMDRSLV